MVYRLILPKKGIIDSYNTRLGCSDTVARKHDIQGGLYAKGDLPGGNDISRPFTKPAKPEKSAAHG